MTDEPEQTGGAEPPAPGITRRRVVITGAASAALGAGIAGGAVLIRSHPRGPGFWYQPNRNGAPPVGGVHLQFGKNAPPTP